MEAIDLWRDEVIITSNSIRRKKRPTYRPKKGQVAKRGEIKGFSDASARRLREYLSRYSVPGSQIYGLTLTLPWHINLDDDSALRSVCAEYRVIWHRFLVCYTRDFPDVALVYRHELQVRKLPHTHVIVYARQHINQSSVFLLWSRAIESLRGGDFDAFRRHGVKLDKVETDYLSLFRYLVDHTSKHKQAQLGFIGKQWGIVNRRAFVTVPSMILNLDRATRTYLFRQLEKITRFRVPAACVFGWRLSRRQTARGLMFVDYSSVSRLLAYYFRDEKK